MNPYTPWETATHVGTDSQPGFLPATTLAPLSLLLALLTAILLWPVMGGTAIVVGLVFGRLAALDLTTYTLPNVYTVPLLVVGLAHAAGQGRLLQALLAALVIILMAQVIQRGGQHLGRQLGMGGGDLKLLAALFAFLPLTHAFFAVAAGCLLWLPVAMLKPKATVPFGVPLLLGWVVLLRWPALPQTLPQHLPNWLALAIS